MAKVDDEGEPAVRGRVLVVDDDDDVRRVLVRVLRRAGHETVEAARVSEGLAFAREHSFDLVVSDVHMPEMDGVDLLRAMREVDANIPVLLLSGAPDLGTAMRAVRYGAFEYLEKPIQSAKLLDSTTRAIALGRKRRSEADDLRQLRSSGRRSELGRGWSADVQPGTLLAGRYRVVRRIGEGGMGAVYEAVHQDLAQMRVAIKVLHAHVERATDFRARFRREAETVAAINHPNIVRVLDFEARDDAPPFLVLELLSGRSLGEAIQSDGPFTERRTAFVGSQVLAALAAAHAARVIHRDLKPDNVFLTSVSGVEDVVKLLDFGLAKVLDPVIDAKLTRTGAILGTPAYMAPETARGAGVDARSDLYAVGGILYELLTGDAPFEGDNYNALIYAIAHSAPRPIAETRPGIDAGLAAIVAKAMAKDPEARFQSADEMRAALRPWADATPSDRAPASGATPIGFAPTIPPPPDDEG